MGGLFLCVKSEVNAFALDALAWLAKRDLSDRRNDDLTAAQHSLPMPNAQPDSGLSQVPHPEFAAKRALVTGGTQGIGKAVAWRLARQGAHVILNYASNDQAALAAQEEFRVAGFHASTEKADIGNPDAVARMLANVHAAGPLDLLVCNAACVEKNRFFETNLDLLKHSLDVNICGNFQIIQEVAKQQISAGRPGSIVLCSSTHGTHVFKGGFAYNVSKAGLNHFMRCVALELIAHKIRVNAVEIGWTHTPGERRWISEDAQDRCSQTIPIRRSAQPDEIAAVVEFLLSDQASYVVGSLFPAEGGFALHPIPLWRPAK